MASRVFVEGAVEDITAAYEDVRSDATETTWMTAVYDGKKITMGSSGSEYDEFLEQLADDARVYGYVRFETGDEMSRRAKFALITWIGSGVGVLKKAAVSTDKAFVKEIMNQFGKEILADEKSEVRYDKILKTLESASGANYGTGK